MSVEGEERQGSSVCGLMGAEGLDLRLAGSVGVFFRMKIAGELSVSGSVSDFFLPGLQGFRSSVFIWVRGG